MNAFHKTAKVMSMKIKKYFMHLKSKFAVMTIRIELLRNMSAFAASRYFVTHFGIGSRHKKI